MLNDHAVLSPRAEEIIDRHIVEVPIEILCEAVYVLHKWYGIDRQDVSGDLLSFFEQTNCILPHRQAVLQGLVYFGQTTLDFADCILAAYATIEGETVYSFDDKLNKHISAIKNN